jgi:hypothetical protein
MLWNHGALVVGVETTKDLIGGLLVLFETRHDAMVVAFRTPIGLAERHLAHCTTPRGCRLLLFSISEVAPANKAV